MRKIRKSDSKKSQGIDLDDAKAMLAALRQLKIPQEKISKDTGIHQSQVSRLLGGDFKKVNGRALELCKYAKNMLHSPRQQRGKFREEIIHSALALWDGSDASGTQLIQVLQSIKKLGLERQKRL